MSNNHLNLYVIKNAKGLNSYETVCANMFGPKKGKFSQKMQLSYLREMSIYLSAVASMDENVFSNAVLYLKDLGDSDADRKLFRTAMYILTEAITEFSTRNELNKKHKYIEILVNLFEKELKQKNSSKQMLIYRSLGAIVHVYNTTDTGISSQTNNSILVNKNINLDSSMKARLLTTFEDLQYPIKQKKSVLFGEDKDFIPKLLIWSSVISGLVRVGESLPQKLWENLNYGLTCIHYKPLAQHSFRLLYLTAKTLKDNKRILQFLNLLLTHRENINITDNICFTFYIRTLTVLIENCQDFHENEKNFSLLLDVETVKAIVGLFADAIVMLQSSNIKIVTELVSALLHKRHGEKLLSLLNLHLKSQHSRGGKHPYILDTIVQVVVNLLNSQDSIESLDLLPLLRVTEQLGRFLVHRPYDASQRQHKLGDSLASVWIALRRQYNACMQPKSDAVGSLAQRRSRGVALRQQRAPAGSAENAAHCAGFPSTSCWSAISENPAIATAAASHGPHILCAVLQAQMWMAPDHRYCPKEHQQLWKSFASSLLDSWDLVISTMAQDFDVVQLLMPLLTQLFERVQSSVTVCAPVPAVASRNNTMPSTPTSLLDLGEVTPRPSATPTEVLLYYQPVYIDVLIALTEKLVIATCSGIAIAFLQSIWQWLSTFTTIKKHPLQTATQLKRDIMHSESSNNGHNSLLIPVVAAPTHSHSSATNSTADRVDSELHADKALLLSITRMTIYAQKCMSIHSTTASLNMGTPSHSEVAQVAQSLYMTGLGQLAQQAILCFALEIVPNNETTGVSVDSGFASHIDALQRVIKTLAEAGSPDSLPNIRNTAILGLVKITAQVLLQQHASDRVMVVDLEKGDAESVLDVLLQELTAMYLSYCAHSIDEMYITVLQQLLAACTAVNSTISNPRSLLIELLLYVLSRSESAAQCSSVSATLQTTLQILCTIMTHSTDEKAYTLPVELRTFLVSQAKIHSNAFILITPSAEEVVDEEVEQEEEVLVATIRDTMKVTETSGDKNVPAPSFDDDLLGEWSSAPTVAVGKKNTIPATSSGSGGLIDFDDIWMSDAPPLQPVKASNLKTNTAGNSSSISNTVDAFDIFGSSGEPLVAAPAHNAEPPERRTSFFRDIYDDEEPAPAATTTVSTSGVSKPALLFDWSDDAPASTARDDGFSSAFPVDSAVAAATGGSIASSSAMDWPGASNTTLVSNTSSASPFSFEPTAAVASESDWLGSTATEVPSTATSAPASALKTVSTTVAAPGSFQDLTKEEQAAAAAAKRAQRKVSTSGSTPTSRSRTGSSTPDRFGSAVDSVAPTSTADSAALDLWPASASNSAIGVDAWATDNAAAPVGVDTWATAAPVGVDAWATDNAAAPVGVDAWATDNAAAPVGVNAWATVNAAAPVGVDAWATDNATAAVSSDAGWGALPDDFGFGPSTTTAAGGAGKDSSNQRKSTAAAPLPGSLEALSKEEQAAIAAAKRANRRQSTSGPAGGKATTPTAAKADPFFNAPAPILKPTAVSSADTWSEVSSVLTPNTTDAWNDVSAGPFTPAAASNTGSVDAFQPSSASSVPDFAPTSAPASDPAAAPVYGGYPPSYAYPPNAAYPPYDPNSFSVPPAGYPGSGYPQAPVPAAGYPESGYSQAPVPPAGYPGSGYPQAPVPAAGYPESGYSQAPVPPAGYPGSGYPQASGYPAPYPPHYDPNYGYTQGPPPPGYYQPYPPAPGQQPDYPGYPSASGHQPYPPAPGQQPGYPPAPGQQPYPPASGYPYPPPSAASGTGGQASAPPPGYQWS